MAGLAPPSDMELKKLTVVTWKKLHETPRCVFFKPKILGGQMLALVLASIGYPFKKALPSHKPLRQHLSRLGQRRSSAHCSTWELPGRQMKVFSILRLKLSTLKSIHCMIGIHQNSRMFHRVSPLLHLINSYDLFLAYFSKFHLSFQRKASSIGIPTFGASRRGF